MHKWLRFKLVMALLLSGLLMTWGAGAVLADVSSGVATGVQKQLTLQQAVNMGIATSPSLISSSYSIDQAKSKVDQQTEPITGLSNLAGFIPTGSTSADIEKAFNSLVSSNLNWQQAKKEYQASQDSVTYSVYRNYYAILQDEAALDVAQQSFNLADLQKRITNLKYQTGGASQYDVIQENQSYAAAQTNLDTAKANLNTDYVKFNQLVGLAPDDRLVLTDQPSFTPLVIGSLDAEVSRVLAVDPAISSAENTVSEQQDALSIVSQDPAANMADRDTLGTAQQGLISAQNSAAQNERTLYHSIIALESKQDSLQQALTTAEANLKITQLKYDVGLANKVDLATAQSSLTSAQLALLGNVVSHQLNVMSFETPWAAGA
ncbi:MAG: TolC family protein [Thermacetogeniaceae bacterium]